MPHWCRSLTENVVSLRVQNPAGVDCLEFHVKIWTGSRINWVECSLGWDDDDDGGDGDADDDDDDEDEDSDDDEMRRHSWCTSE